MKIATLRKSEIKNILPKMIIIPKGPYRSGSNDHQFSKPQRTICLAEFKIAEVPVTRILWGVVRSVLPIKDQKDLALEGWGSETIGIGKEINNPINLDHPVVNVTINQAILFCERLSELTGEPFRLPTDQEWEKAARGTDERKYPWGNEEPTEDDYFHLKEEDYPRDRFVSAGLCRTRPVGILANGASPYGVLDMADNVREWAVLIDGKNWTMEPALCGGSWHFGPRWHSFFRVDYMSNERAMPKNSTYYDIGLRLAI